MSHTPGPWKVREIAFEDAARRAFVVETADRRIANISNAKGGIAADLYGVEQPNARLIAAAPDLLEACKAALEWMAEQQVYSGPPSSLISQAIQKALYGNRAEGGAV